MTIHTLMGPGGATENKQDAILAALALALAELQTKFEAGEEVELGAVSLAALENITATLSGAIALDATTLAALESVTATVSNWPTDFPDAAALVVLNNIETLLGVQQTNGLTDAELRATPVAVSLDATTLAALETITVLVQAGQVIGLDVATLAALESITVSGSVALDAPTLAALENISASVTGIVALDAPTLAALEQITVLIAAGQIVGLDAATLTALENVVVSGTVALDAPTLAALESVTAVVSGTVALDGPTLAALENITAAVSGTVELGAATLAALENITAIVSGTVAVSNFPAEYPLPAAQVAALTPPTDGLTDVELRAAALAVVGTDFDIRNLALLQDSVRQTMRALKPASFLVAGPQTEFFAITPAAGMAIRLLRIALHVDPQLSEAIFPEIVIKLEHGGSSDTIYYDKLQQGFPWSEQCCFEGLADEKVRINISATGNYYFNFRYEEFDPTP